MSYDRRLICSQLQLESIYRSVTVVANICVYAALDKSRPIAIIVPAEPALKKIAGENGVKGDHLEELTHNDKLNSAVLKQLQDAGRKGGLAPFEIIEGVVLADEEWTPQNVSIRPRRLINFLANNIKGFTTAATKINRKVILNKYTKEVDKAYGNSS